MNVKDYVNLIHMAERLKDTPRHCFTSGGRRESVAEHCWRISLMAYFLQDEFPGIDINKVIKMCIMHDMGEAFTGDIPVFDKTEADEAKESSVLNTWVQSLPEPYRSDLTALYAEMDALETLEAKVYKSMDSLEAVFQHNESDISTWEDHEYDLNLNYGWDKVEFSEYTKSIRQTLQDETKLKIATERDEEGVFKHGECEW